MPRSLHLRTLLRAAIATAVVLVPAVTSAQTSTTTPPSSGTQPQTLVQLQREALRLTLIARLPAADQQQATRLLDRADALVKRERTLVRQELQAYVEALKAGTAPAEARTQARQKVASERAALDKAVATLRTDAQSFLQKVPQARTLLRYFMMETRLGRGSGAGALGLGLGQGMAPRGRGYAPGYGRGYGPRGYGPRGYGYGDRGYGYGPMGGTRNGPWSMGQGFYWGQPGGMQRGWGRDDMPYGRFGNGVGPGMMGPWRMPSPNAPQQNAPQNTTPPAGSGNGGT